jgi:hypothetical protein
MARYHKGQAAPAASEINRGDDRPKTRLAELLREAREEFLRSGEPMLDADGLEREIAERRGGVICA